MPQAAATRALDTDLALPSGMIATSLPIDDPIAALIVFPRTESALVPRPLRRFRGVALLRIVDGTVWMLTLPGRAWTVRRLRAAATALSKCSRHVVERRHVEYELRRALEMAPVSVVEPRLDAVDPGQWEIPETARAMIERGGPIPWASDNSALSNKVRIRSVESLLSTELSVELRTFVSGLNPNVCAAASTDGRIDVALYNYLVCAKFSRFRLQFAATFPSLMSTTVKASPGSLGAELRTIVDQGAPVIKSLAKRLRVRPGVVRHLIGRPPEQIGTQWTSNIKALATVLNALRPEDLPSDGEAWTRLSNCLTIGQRIFVQPVWHSSPALRWLRESVYHANRGSHRTRLQWLPDRSALERIGRYRRALAAVLRHAAGAQTLDRARAVSVSVEETVDQFLFRSAHSGLAKLAAQFEAEIIRYREELKQVSKIMSGDAMWSLIPADFVSSDGSRLIQPLTSYTQLWQHGSVLRNCLAKGYAFQYLRAGREATRFIVGVLEADSEVPCSTAEIIVKQYPETLTYELVVVQHTALENAEPSAACARAVDELIRHCRSPEVRRHLNGAWRLIRHSTEPSRRGEQVESDPATRTALKRTLGDSVYEALLAETAQALEKL